MTDEDYRDWEGILSRTQSQEEYERMQAVFQEKLKRTWDYDRTWKDYD